MDTKSTPLVGIHATDVWAFARVLETGTTITVFKSVPGDSQPRMSVSVVGSDPFANSREIASPDRFGPYDTLDAFRAFVQAFHDTIPRRNG